MSESWVSVGGHGSSNRTMTQSILQKAPINGLTKHRTVLKWPAANLHLIPIEHLWRGLRTAVGRRHPSNLGDLVWIAEEEFANSSRAVQEGH